LAKRSEIGKIKYRPNTGVGCVEAPRGSLLHDYSIDETASYHKSELCNTNEQNIGNLEEDMRHRVPELLDQNKTQEK